MSRKRKAGENEDSDRTKKSKSAQDPGRQPAFDQALAAKAAAAKGTDGRSSKAADASQQGADDTDG
jgi:hypothetical protein